MEEKISGFLLVNKPAGISSFGAVYKVRKILRDLTGQKYKVGHSGTLDPAATGLLILAIGKSTKQLHMLLKKDKVYEVELKLGYSSTTDDSEGEINLVSTKKPSEDEVKSAVNSFIGKITQTPPIYSAVKVGGQRAYKLARNGQQPVIEPRQVRIYSITDISYDYPAVKFKCHVGSGTYIRSLVKDIGEKLETGAYMTSLKRVLIDKFDLNDAHSLEDLNQDNLKSCLVSLE